MTVTVDLDWPKYMARHRLTLPRAVPQRLRCEMVPALRVIPEAITILTRVERVE